jgi:hypothetical protein
MNECQHIVALSALLLGASQGALAKPASEIPVVEGTVGYALTDMRWSVYQAESGDAECPDGLNNSGPREQFDALYPKQDQPRALKDTVLRREAAIWLPEVQGNPFPWREARGATGFGLDLNGRSDAEDFTSPDGERGVDNELYRVIGCVEEFRGPTGRFYHLINRFVRDFAFNRVLIEIRGVDSLSNDDNVQVVSYRGLDRLLVDATGTEIIPGGTQRIDRRWGKRYIQQWSGTIKDGVLTTDAADITLPRSIYESMPGEQYLRDGRLRLKVSTLGASGLLAGYADVEHWYRQMMQSSSGQFSYPALRQALQHRADAFPDPRTGENTAISSSFNVSFTRVFIFHPEGESLPGERETTPGGR